MMKNIEVCVIGGGASGLIAAISAKSNGAQVTLVERNAKLGKKILVTGNGRCNYTNVLATAAQYNHPAFVQPVLEQFSPERTLAFFENLGIPPKIEDEGKTYPLSEQASSIVDVLVYEVERLGIAILLDTKVASIKKTNGRFLIQFADGRKTESDRVIVCAGGLAMPQSGSDGSGFELAIQLGHKVTPTFPALVKLLLESPHLKHLDGVKINSTVELMLDNRVIQSEHGDILFTKYGISGPTILQLSREANARRLAGESLFVKVVLVDSLGYDDIAKRLEMVAHKSIQQGLIGLIHTKIIPILLQEAGIKHPQEPISALTPKDKGKLIRLLFDWRFPITGTKGFEDAQVTAGGVDIQFVSAATLESKTIPGLFFAGEVLDIDGLCGGFNLQWAWSSGYVAGKAAAK
jgi:predicted Rossmann fold flavoprotein